MWPIYGNSPLIHLQPWAPPPTSCLPLPLFHSCSDRGNAKAPPSHHHHHHLLLLLLLLFLHHHHHHLASHRFFFHLPTTLPPHISVFSFSYFPQLPLACHSHAPFCTSHDTRRTLHPDCHSHLAWRNLPHSPARTTPFLRLKTHPSVSAPASFLRRPQQTSLRQANNVTEKYSGGHSPPPEPHSRVSHSCVDSRSTPRKSGLLPPARPNTNTMESLQLSQVLADLSNLGAAVRLCPSPCGSKHRSC